MPRQIRSLVTEDGTLELSIAQIDMPEPDDHEVIVAVEAAPINPSDLGLLLGPADIDTLTSTGSGDEVVVRADIPEALRRSLAARVGQSLPVGNEGAGTVVAAGAADDAQALLSKKVGGVGGAMYGDYRVVPAFMCIDLPEDVEAAQGASCFVNPLTALAMVDTMRMEGHSAIVHTAAASNLGQMLVKLCAGENVPLVNVVRRAEQVELLRDLGAEHVCNSSDDDFMSQLIDAVAETGATIAFDATGGGDLGSRILTAMEAAASRVGGEYSRYGSDTFKQLYIYGGLDRSPTVLHRSFGFSWSVAGFLLTPFLQKVGMERAAELRARVRDELTTTFASSYTAEISLTGALDLDTIRAYAKQATGEKYLINPTLDRS